MAKYRSILEREIDRAKACIKAIEDIKLAMGHLEDALGDIVHKESVQTALFHATAIASAADGLEKKLAVLHEIMDIMEPDTNGDPTLN